MVMVLPADTAKMFCELADEKAIFQIVVSNGLSGEAVYAWLCSV